MSRKSERKTKQTKKPSCSDDENAELDSFCAEISHLEVSFETWQSYHSQLDLYIPVFLSLLELNDGVTKTVNFSRLISDEDGQVRRVMKSIIFSVPAGSAPGKRILFNGQGDRHGSLCGDLVIVLHTKEGV